ncbi:MAG: hypothetical protein IAX21_07600 [Candidatus Bathyarchaeota archaeon]|nr:MAG: hypothetical protein NUK63_10080 [Candidatus Bathyarchaeum tardum]WNZ28520.1 MAG: hypothetical protein IAX21_07600 [Candidatus Bathyarchaeota archaeon]
MLRNASEGYKIVFEAKKLIKKCKEEYNYDIATSRKDQRNGKTTVGSAPIRFIYKHLRPTSKSQ